MDKIYFQNINRDDLSELLIWYKNADEFLFATGIDRQATDTEIESKLFEEENLDNQIFDWICIKDTNERIGIIKGFYKEKEKVLWIKTLMIKPEYQSKGYGTKAFEKITQNNFEINKVYISVLSDNIKGLNFWNSLGFMPMNEANKTVLLDGKNKKIMIMYKVFTKA